jgi:hypothetical protein
MGIMNYMKNAAISFVAPSKKLKMNPSKPDVYPTYHDVNRDGEDPILKPKKPGINLLNPVKDSDKDISHDKHGNYVSTITYPLPPLSWEKKQFDNNRRIRNGKNKYL